MALNEGPGKGRAGDADRDPALDRVYASADRAEPPRHLDAAILAAAHREAGARPRRLSAARTWRAPVALAAMIVLSVSLVTLMQEEGGDELGQPVRPDVPRAAEPAAPAPQPEAAASAARDAPARAPQSRNKPDPGPAMDDRGRAQEPRRPAQEAETGAAREPVAKPEPQPFLRAPASAGERADGQAMNEAAPAASAERSAPPAMSAPPPAKAASPRAMRRERDMSPREDAAGAASGGIAAPERRAVEAQRALGELSSAQKRESAPPMQPRVAAMVKELDPQPPEKWLERIQALRREGQSAEARELLAEFKRRYPAHPLPPELQ
jgi:hypothetical protein